jgi:flagellum-specific ATP synthase
LSDSTAALLDAITAELSALPDRYRYGRVTGVRGMMVEIGGLRDGISVGGRCNLMTRDGRALPCPAAPGPARSRRRGSSAKTLGV